MLIQKYHQRTYNAALDCSEVPRRVLLVTTSFVDTHLKLRDAVQRPIQMFQRVENHKYGRSERIMIYS